MAQRLSIRALLLLALLAAQGCRPSAPARTPAAGSLAGQLDADLAAARRETSAVAAEFERVFASGIRGAPLYPDRKYAFFAKKLWYGGGDGRTGLVMAMGCPPVDAGLMARTRALERFEPLLKRVTETCPLVSMSWIATQESTGVFYPAYDAVAYAPPGLCVPSEILPYRKAAPSDNPSGAPVWVEPYIDMTGKGYMVTLSMPLRVGGKFAAVAGADIALEPVSRRFSALGDRALLLLSQEGYVVFATAAAQAATGLKALEDLYYLSQVRTDVPAATSFRLEEQAAAGGPARGFREALAAGDPRGPAVLGSARYRIEVAPVPEAGWRLVELTAAD